jgi:hypothetical protein
MLVDQKPRRLPTKNGPYTKREIEAKVRERAQKRVIAKITSAGRVPDMSMQQNDSVLNSKVLHASDSNTSFASFKSGGILTGGKVGKLRALASMSN